MIWTTDAALAARFRRQIRFWTITAIVLAVLLYVFSDILLPFVAGMVLAYFLDPVADRLQRLGLSRAHGDGAHPVRLRRRADAGAGDRHPDPGHAALRFHRPAAAISEPAAGADHRHRSAMAGKDLRRQRGRASRGAELAAHRGLRLHHHDLRVDLGVRRGAVQHRRPVRGDAGGRLLHAARLGPHGRQGRQLGAARACGDGARHRHRHQHRRRPASCAGKARCRWRSASTTRSG